MIKTRKKKKYTFQRWMQMFRVLQLFIFSCQKEFNYLQIKKVFHRNSIFFFSFNSQHPLYYVFFFCQIYILCFGNIISYALWKYTVMRFIDIWIINDIMFVFQKMILCTKCQTIVTPFFWRIKPKFVHLVITKCIIFIFK